MSNSSTFQDIMNHCDSVEEAAEIVGTASITVIPAVEIKKEPLDSTTNENSLGQLFFKRPVMDLNSKFKLNVNVKEKSGKAFDLLNTNGLPWSFPTPSVSGNTERNSQAIDCTNEVPSTINNDANHQEPGPSNIAARTVSESDGGHSSEIPKEECMDISIEARHQSNNKEDGELFPAWNCDGDEECEIVEEHFIYVKSLRTEVERRHPFCTYRTTDDFPITSYEIGDSSTNAQGDLPECNMDANDEEQGEKTIQFNIDAVPTVGSDLAENWDQSAIKITSHTCKTPSRTQLFNLEIGNGTTDSTHNINSPGPPNLSPQHPSDSHSMTEELDAIAQWNAIANSLPEPEELPLTQQESQEVHKSEVQSYRPTAHVSPPFNCSKCTLTFRTEKALRGHQLYHGWCLFCHRKFANLHSAVVHMVGSHGEQDRHNPDPGRHNPDPDRHNPDPDRHNLDMGQDNAATGNRNETRDRREIRDNPDPGNPQRFACTKCPRTYLTRGRFNRHLRTHTAVKNTCVKCRRNFMEKPTYHRKRNVEVLCAPCKNKYGAFK